MVGWMRYVGGDWMVALSRSGWIDTLGRGD